jgi:hypothetical protein
MDVAFMGLDTSEMQKAMRSGGANKPFIVWANLVLTIRHLNEAGEPLNMETKQVRAGLKLLQDEHGTHADAIPVRLEGLRQKVGYTLMYKDTNMAPGDLQATFEIVPDEPVMQGYFQVLRVPYIQVLWWGVYVMVLGGILSFVRRRGLARRTAAATPRGAAAPSGTGRRSSTVTAKPGLAGASLKSLREAQPNSAE